MLKMLKCSSMELMVSGGRWDTGHSVFFKGMATRRLTMIQRVDG